MTDQEFIDAVEIELRRPLSEEEKIYALNQLPRYSGSYPIKQLWAEGKRALS
jgi:hypothetical protein